MKYFFFTLWLTGLSMLGFTQPIVALEPTAISPLLIREKIPTINLSDMSGKKINLLELVAQKPSVLIFYRGGWCPDCSLHLSELQMTESNYSIQSTSLL